MIQAQTEIETNEQYHADTTRLSNSMLSILKRSPKLFWGYYIAKCLAFPEASESMALGSMVHTLVLEADQFHKRYVSRPQCDRRTKEGKQIYQDFLSACPTGAEVVSLEDKAVATVCATALATHKDFLSIMNATWENRIVEQRIDFEMEGVEMRCKPDYLSLEASVIIDVKTTRDASPSEFAKSIASFGYHRQAWLYRYAVAQKHNVWCRFIFAVVCTEQPYESALYELSDLSMSEGGKEAIGLVNEFKTRSESGDWSSEWSKGIVPIDLPKWYKSVFYEVQ